MCKNKWFHCYSTEYSVVLGFTDDQSDGKAYTAHSVVCSLLCLGHVGHSDTLQSTACLHHEAGLITGIGAGLLLF